MSADKFFLVATILALGIAVAIAMFGAWGDKDFPNLGHVEIALRAPSGRVVAVVATIFAWVALSPSW